tara:strand:+ start:132 stop:734 length:603 start_codon:yes stop_codon:yes gene_type:complete
MAKKRIKVTSTHSKSPGGLSPQMVAQKKLAASQFGKVDGQISNQQGTPARTLILKANSILSAQNYTCAQEVSTFTTKKLAQNLLKDLGCTDAGLPPTFSFMQTKTKNKASNPNINIPNTQQQGNTRVSAKANFPNDCDPIYNLDEPMTNAEKNNKKLTQQSLTPNLTLTAMTMVQMNLLSNKSLALKPFLEETSIKRSSF